MDAPFISILIDPVPEIVIEIETPDISNSK